MSNKSKCKECEGRGVVDTDDDQVMCGSCQGTGWIYQHPLQVRLLRKGHSEACVFNSSGGLLAGLCGTVKDDRPTHV